MKKTLFFFSLLFLVCFQPLFAQEERTLENLDVFDMEWASNPQISPDGTKIVYQRQGFDIMTDRSASHLWIMNADGTGHRKLFEGEEGES